MSCQVFYKFSVVRLKYQAWQPPWFRAVWSGLQGGVAVTCSWGGGGGSEDSEGRVWGGGQGQVPPGGSHHGTVQAP